MFSIAGNDQDYCFFLVALFMKSCEQRLFNAPFCSFFLSRTTKYLFSALAVNHVLEADRKKSAVMTIKIRFILKEADQHYFFLPKRTAVMPHLLKICRKRTIPCWYFSLFMCNLSLKNKIFSISFSQFHGGRHSTGRRSSDRIDEKGHDVYIFSNYDNTD